MQRHQLVKVNKDELIDIILSSSAEEDELASLKSQICQVLKEMQSLKETISSPDSVINKNYSELKNRVDKQAEIIAKQQQFLEYLDRKEREANIVILGVPEEQEALDGVIEDREKIN